MQNYSVSCEAVATSASSCSRAEVEQWEQDEIVAAQVNLFQGVSSSFKRRLDDARSQLSVLKPSVSHEAIPSRPPAPDDYLQASTPLAWTHVPKCGSSFLNSLVRLPGVCPNLDVGDTVLDTPEVLLADHLLWFEKEVVLGCDGLINCGLHVPVGSMFKDVYLNHGVIMLRQPEQRVISMYNHAMERGDASGFELIDKYNMALIDFANATAGCAVRMMTKDAGGWNGCMGVNDQQEFTTALEVSVSDVVVARKRLRGYAFVGITDYWAESICLLHAMFGGECHPAEFADNRNGSQSASSYDTGVLQGYVDQYDGALYEEALSIFAQSLRWYEVTQNSCQQCFESGGLSATSQVNTFAFLDSR